MARTIRLSRAEAEDMRNASYFLSVGKAPRDLIWKAIHGKLTALRAVQLTDCEADQVLWATGALISKQPDREHIWQGIRHKLCEAPHVPDDAVERTAA